jgi:hypothetical protein
MQNTVLLQFSTLTDLATFIRKVHPAAYIINTMRLTITADLSGFEIAVALEQFGGVVVQQQTEAVCSE